MLALSDTDILDERRDEPALDSSAQPSQRGTLAFSKPAAPVTRSRLSAMTLAEASESGHSVREQAISPLVQRAATELVELDDKGHKTDIKLQGRPYEVLEDIIGELGSIGASRFVTAQVLKALEEFSIHEGLSFSKQAKARPLYARIMVTSEKPDDLPDCEKFQYTFLDGIRRMGRDASTRGNVRPTIHGTQSSGSAIPGMNEMFELSKSKGLLLFFASVEGSDQNKFDDVDNNLMTLLQAFLGDTCASSIEDIEAMILEGTLSPEAAELIKTLAEYQHLRIESATPGAIEHAEEKLAEIKSEIEALLEQDLSLPENVLEAIENRFEATSALVEVALPELEQAAAEIVQDANVATPDAEAAEDLLSLIELLSDKLDTGDLDEMPPEIVDLLETIGGIEAAIEAQGRDAVLQQISEMIAVPDAQTDVAKAVQTLVLALNDPAVQLAMPQDVLNQTNIFLKANADTVETIVQNVIIQDLKASLPALEKEPEAAKLIEAVFEKLQDGKKLDAADVEIISKVKEQVQGPVSETLSIALKAAQNAITPNMVLAADTLRDIGVIKNDLTAVQEAIVSLQTDGKALEPAQQQLVQKIKEVVEILDRDPSNIHALQQLSSLNKVIAAPENAAILPASVTSVVERVTRGVENVAGVHEAALSIKHDVSVQNVRETVKLIETLVASKTELGAADVKIERVIGELGKNISSVAAAAELTKIQSVIDKAPPEVAKVLKAQVETVVSAQVEAVSQKTGLSTEAVRSTLDTIKILESAPATVREALKQADVSVAEVVTALKSDIGGVEGLKAMTKLEGVVAQMPAEAKAALSQQLGGKIDVILSGQTERVAEKLGVSVQAVKNSVALVVAIESNKEIAQALKAANIDVARIAANPVSTAALVESTKIQSIIDKAPPEMAKAIQRQIDTAVRAQTFGQSDNIIDARDRFRSTFEKAGAQAHPPTSGASYQAQQGHGVSTVGGNAVVAQHNHATGASVTVHDAFQRSSEKGAGAAPVALPVTDLDKIRPKAYEGLNVVAPVKGPEKAHGGMCDGCTSDCGSCSKGAARSDVNNALRAMKAEGSSPLAAPSKPEETKYSPVIVVAPVKGPEKINGGMCDGCTTKDCGSCSKGAARSDLDKAMSAMKAEGLSPLAAPSKPEETKYSPVIVVAPVKGPEKINGGMCDGCTSRDCGSCSKGAARSDVDKALRAMKDEGLSSFTSPSKPEETKYNPVNVVAPVSGTEKTHGGMCDGCTSRDCGSCSKGAARSDVDKALRDLKAEGLSSLATTSNVDNQYKSAVVVVSVDRKDGSIPTDPCSICTTKNCGSCSKFAAMDDLNKTLSGMSGTEYESLSPFSRAKSDMTPLEIANTNACDVCTHKNCGSCALNVAKDALNTGLSELKNEYA